MMKSKFAKKFLSGAAALVVAASGSICGFAAEGSVDSPLLLSGSEILTGALGLADEVTENTEDFGYEGNLNIKFGEGVTEAIEMELKPIDISAKINSKGGNSSVDVSVKYDSQTLATLNGLYEGATGMMYARIPELNDA